MYFQPSAEGEKFTDVQNLWSLLAPQDIHGLDHVRMPVGFLGDEPFGAGNRPNWPNINALCSFCDKPLHLFQNPMILSGFLHRNLPMVGCASMMEE